MKVIGYSGQLSVFPGQDVDFHVSCDTGHYHADIVKLIHGDTNPDGPGFKIEPVQTAIDTDLPGRVQRIHSGSHVLVDDDAKLRLTERLTLQAMICPTTPDKGVQGVLTKWNAETEAGYGLFLGDDGCAQFWLGDGRGQTVRLSSGKPLLQGIWYLLAATLDDDGSIVVTQQPHVTSTNGRFTLATSFESTTATVTDTTSVRPAPDNGVPLAMAGSVSELTDEPIGVVVGHHFNGKIDRPRLHSAALSPAELVEQTERPRGEYLVAAWNFQEEITAKGVRPTRRITDVSPNLLHGYTINLPARGVTGYNWDSHEQNFIHAPAQYGAIHFHDDDLDDARWKVDFTLPVPDDLPSGVYAARLVATTTSTTSRSTSARGRVRRRRSASSCPPPVTWPTPTTTCR